MKTSEILQGDVLFVWGKRFIEEAIEHVTHGASHCALFVDSETLVEAQGGRTTGSSPLSSYLNTGDRLEVWRDLTLTDDERSQIVKFAKDHFGIKYDYMAILEELVHFELGISIDDYHEGKRRICSSFVNDCAKSIGHDWANIKHVPAPQDLLVSGKLTRIGNI